MTRLWEDQNKLWRQTNISEMELKKRIIELEKKLAHYEDNCTIVWMPEDVLSLDETLTDEQVSYILGRLEHKHDATLGITWDTIEFWINEVKA